MAARFEVSLRYFRMAVEYCERDYLNWCIAIERHTESGGAEVDHGVNWNQEYADLYETYSDVVYIKQESNIATAVTLDLQTYVTLTKILEEMDNVGRQNR